ncbi:MAG TPA: histidine kinase [Actinomycetota bacterium]|jgi:signal transduction histidine kinase
MSDEAGKAARGETPLNARTAKLLSRAVVAAVIAMLVTQVVLVLVGGHRLVATEIATVGDPNAPGMAAVRTDLEHIVAGGGSFGSDNPLGSVAFAAVALIWGITGSLIVSRQPRNSAGWIFCIAAGAVALNSFGFAYTVYGVRILGSPLPAQDPIALFGEYSFAVAVLIPLLVLLFPDGRPPSRRWRWATWVLLAGFAIAVVSYALTPGPLNNFVEAGILYANPFGVMAFADGRPLNALVGVGVLLILGASLATVVAVWQRFRHARGEERQQMRWLVVMATIAGTGLALILLLTPILALFGVEDENGAGAVIFACLFATAALAIFVGIPAAYLIAIFKHGLWDLDVVIKKALVASVLTLVLIGLGLVAIGIFGQPALWGGNRLGVAIGVIAGLLIWPLVRAARRVARRLVFGKRAAPYEVLSEFAERVGETYATEDVLPRMARILAEGTAATSARVWIHVGGELRAEAAWPQDVADREAVPFGGDELPEFDGESAFEVRDRGEVLGALSVAMPASDPMNPSKERLVRDLASQAGLVLRNVRLIQELRASRQRLVASQDEERRKLERDLHDGAQQQLVALAVHLKLARTMVERDPATVGDMLEALQGSATDALADLRDLARGIYPQLLADRGLAAALEAQASKSTVPTTVRSDGVGRYAREVEAAVYFSCLEALNNVAKYSVASSATVSLAQANGTLTFTVVDDGIGFDAAGVAHGTGLQGIADRLDAIGGDVRVRSAPGEGTTVTGTVPAEDPRS